jgi:hypothetical protein
VSKIGGGAKDEEAHTASMGDESDKASADFGHNPEGWREFCFGALSRALVIFAILPASRFAPRSKIVPAPHGFHSEMHS